MQQPHGVSTQPRRSNRPPAAAHDSLDAYSCSHAAAQYVGAHAQSAIDGAGVGGTPVGSGDGAPDGARAQQPQPAPPQYPPARSAPRTLAQPAAVA